MPSPPATTSDPQRLDPEVLRSLQRQKLGLLLQAIGKSKSFYSRKFDGIAFNASVDPLEKLPFTLRGEIEQDQLDCPPYGTLPILPLAAYSRFHQTSGTNGRPMRVIDTADSWNWVKHCWKTILVAADVRAADRLLFPFSFGPFLGFWSAFESACELGCLCIPAGGMSSSGRVKLLAENQVDVVLCTPTYALRLSETAQKEGIDLASGSVKKLIVAGEPGGSVPEIRAKIEAAWGARVFDHHGMTETGPVSFECVDSSGGLHVNEAEFIAEVIDPDTGKAIADGAMGELVLTGLGRTAWPLIRYRTGDLVRINRRPCACGRTFARLDGGILGRRDDMIVVRGNNVFPSAIEALIRSFPQVEEFRVVIGSENALTDLKIQIEPDGGSIANAELSRRVAAGLQSALSFRAEVECVAPGTLPRFEMKSRRFVREDTSTLPG